MAKAGASTASLLITPMDCNTPIGKWPEEKGEGKREEEGGREEK